MSGLQINGQYVGGHVYVPYVRLPNSAASTVLKAPLSSYLSGTGGNSIAAVVPAAVSTLIDGYDLRLGQVVPNDEAYQLNSGGALSNKIAWVVVENDLSGPGVYLEAFDIQYLPTNTTLTKTTMKLFKAMLNQPVILSGPLCQLAGMCQRNQIYINNATSTMYPRIGNVTFGPAAEGSQVDVLDVLKTEGILQWGSPNGGGFFGGVEGFSACGQNVGFNAEACDTAAKNVAVGGLIVVKLSLAVKCGYWTVASCKVWRRGNIAESEIVAT